jgi:hypothetical protein
MRTRRSDSIDDGACRGDFADCRGRNAQTGNFASLGSVHPGRECASGAASEARQYCSHDFGPRWLRRFNTARHNLHSRCRKAVPACADTRPAVCDCSERYRCRVRECALPGDHRPVYAATQRCPRLLDAYLNANAIRPEVLDLGFRRDPRVPPRPVLFFKFLRASLARTRTLKRLALG